MYKVALVNMDTVYFVGHAQLPKNIPAHELYGTIALGLEVDLDTGQIINVSINLATELSRQIIVSCLINSNLNNGIKPLIAAVERKYQGDAQRAIVMAIRNAYNRYLEFSGRP